MKSLSDAHQPWQAGAQDQKRRTSYAEHEQQARLQAQRLAVQERLFAPWRLLLFVAMVGSFFVVLPRLAQSWLWIVLPLFLTAAFVRVLTMHRTIRERLDRARFDQSSFERVSALLSEQTVQPCKTESIASLEGEAALLAGDLDLLGPASLHQRLSWAQTGAGQQLLADWMAQACELSEIRERQAAVQELEMRLDWRQELAARCRSSGSCEPQALLGEMTSEAPDPQGLRAKERIVALVALLGLLILIAALLIEMPDAWRLGAVVGVGLMAFGVRAFFEIPEVPASDRMARRLATLKAMRYGLEWIEAGSFESQRLKELQAKLLERQGQEAASCALKRYQRSYSLYLAGRTDLFSVFAFFVSWCPFFALRLERQRAQLAPRFSAFVDSIGQFEVLSSLAAYAFEQPQDCYPQYVENTDPGVLNIERLRHPLIARSKAVRNPLSIGVDKPTAQLIVLSGSNMSGKSTYLRSAALAVILARLGTRVPATAMRCSNWRLGTHLRSQDSLAEGKSRFGAEVARVASIVHEARASKETPFLFLLDEVFSGTNSHDREIAVNSLVRELLEQRCVGWITTHDLALTKIATELAPKTQNQHFEDQFDEEAMSFDYRLRPGVVQKSNALALMRHAGLLEDIS